MRIEERRKTFESLAPKPNHVWWDGESHQYKTYTGEAVIYNAVWRGFLLSEEKS